MTLTQEKSKIMTTKCSQVRLFTEEVDKITSLVIGLSSRLAKASLVTNNQQDEKLQVTMMTMMLTMMRLLLMIMMIIGCNVDGTHGLLVKGVDE